MRRLSLHLSFFMTIVLCLSLASCMVGPNFHSPAAPPLATYTHTKLPTKTASTAKAGQAGKSQHLIYGLDLPAAWWTLFRSPELDALICTGLANSPNLAAAKATLTQAQENLRAQFGSLLLPSINGQLGGERERFSDTSLGVNQSNLFDVYNAGVNVGYTLDLFGASRRQLESLGANVDFERFELIGAYLTLTSNIVTTAITVASLTAQIEATKHLIKEEGDQLHILKEQLRLGGISNLTVLTQETLYSQTRALLPALQNNLAQSQHALAVLVGILPSQFIFPEIHLNTLYLPKNLPLSVPSNLVRQRPDVQASEALLHAASAQIGVATANLFPQISLTGNYGWEGPIPKNLFNSITNTWSYAGQLAQPLFQGGSLLAKRRAAIAAYQAAFAQYRQTVLVAFQNVADSLRAIEFDARRFKEQKNAETAAFSSLKLTREQFNLGAVNYLALLIAEQQYQQALITRIQAQSARYTDTAALFQALGGGWWHTDIGRTKT